MELAKKKMYIILLILGVMGILDSILVLLVSSINLGTVLPGVVGVFLVFWSISQFYFPQYLQKYSFPYLKKPLAIGFFIWLISFLIIEGLIINNHSADKNVKADYLIILGAGIRGETVSLTLYTRLNTGLDYLLENPDMKVIVSGGKGPGEDITEAEAMRRFLVSRGIEETRIIKEESSTSTFENFKHSQQQILKNRRSKVLIVTNDFHIYRAKLLAKRAGLIPYGLPSKTPHQVLVNCYLREYFAVIKSYFFDR